MEQKRMSLASISANLRALADGKKSPIMHQMADALDEHIDQMDVFGLNEATYEAVAKAVRHHPDLKGETPDMIIYGLMDKLNKEDANPLGMDDPSTVRVFWSDEDQAFIAANVANPGLSAFGDYPSDALREYAVALSMKEATDA